MDKNPAYNIGIHASGGDNLTKNPNRHVIIENIKIGSQKWRDSLSIEERKELLIKLKSQLKREIKILGKNHQVIIAEILQLREVLNQRRGNSDRPLCQFSTNARNEKFRDERRWDY